jgi:IrrE N-terminal-like domain
MISRLQILQDAAKAALRYRAVHGYALDRPCDVYKLISHGNTDLQFVDIPSLEGMFLQEGRLRRICVCERRPAGRQRFTAAHELGHCVLAHGSMVDVEQELGEAKPSNPEEHAADVFARYLLMPPRAVHAGFRCRGSDPESPTPMQVYIVSSWLGVGYATLVNHMALTLNLYGPRTREALLKTPVKQLKRVAASISTSCDVWMIDNMWTDSTLHTQIGDIVRGLAELPSSGDVLVDCGPNTWICRSAGEGSFAVNGGGSVRICVSRRDYIGFYKYRYLPELSRA